MKARLAAPWLLFFEDVDISMTNQVQSFFFNKANALEHQNGIPMITSTNNREIHHQISDMLS